MNINFADKHVVVTGGTGALGTAVTEKLIEAGASCSIPCYDESELENFKLESHEQLFIQLDVDLTSEEQTQDFFTKAVNRQGPLWGSVHIAGGFAAAPIEQLTKADFMKQINMNLVTCFNCCRMAVSHMREHGGRVVNVSSRPGIEARHGAGRVPYATSKAGVAALTESLAAEVVSDDILINAIAPSVIDTPANRKSMPDADFEKWTKPKELAAQILYLISEQNTITRGAVVPVYGKS
ncbi:MAG TPA: SDR family NAD(P)-dependent oxidoreductase [Balneolaceae bacterium]|nr:SDR family NAD(P)-dependent oxidoreductase [Balneolaceae bacterium]